MGNETDPNPGWSPINYLPESQQALAHNIVDKLVGPDSIGAIVLEPMVEGIDRAKSALAAEVKSGGHLHIEPALLWAGVIARPEFKALVSLLHKGQQSPGEQDIDTSNLEDK